MNSLDSKHNYVFLNCLCFIVNSLRCGMLFFFRIVPTGIKYFADFFMWKFEILFVLFQMERVSYIRFHHL